MHDEFEANGIIRRFSERVYSEDPHNVLATSLVVAEANSRQEERIQSTLEQQWKALFEPVGDDELNNKSLEGIILERPARDLAKTYKEFLKCLPKGYEVRIKDGPPRLDAVVEAVEAVNSNFRNRQESTKTGRIKAFFHKVTGSLNDHQDLFALIPSGDKYISLLTGSISAIVKASVRHEEIAGSVSDALDDLSEDIEYCKRFLKVHGNGVRIRGCIAKLYAIIFEFLTSIMSKWLSKSSFVRGVGSFSDALKKQIEGKKLKIKDLLQKLERESKLAVEQTLPQLATKADIENLFVTQQAKFEVLMEQQRRSLGQTAQSALRDEAKNFLWEFHPIQVLTHNASRVPMSEISPQSRGISSAEPDIVYTKEQIQFNALRPLRQHIQMEDTTGLIEKADGLYAHIEIFNRIREWNAMRVSHTIWIQGPFQAPTPSRYTLLSAYVVATAQRASVPVISYFCKPDHHGYRVDNRQLVTMIYTLIAQLNELLPNAFRSHLDFTSDRFDILDGTAASLAQAISLFKDLISVGPPTMFCEIDGLQIVENKKSIPLLRDFVDALHSAGSTFDSDTPQIIKTLFTTDGFTDVFTNLKGNERLDVSDFSCEDGKGPECDSMEMSFL